MPTSPDKILTSTWAKQALFFDEGGNADSASWLRNEIYMPFLSTANRSPGR